MIFHLYAFKIITALPKGLSFPKLPNASFQITDFQIPKELFCSAEETVAIKTTFHQIKHYVQMKWKHNKTNIM